MSRDIPLANGPKTPAGPNELLFNANVIGRALHSIGATKDNLSNFWSFAIPEQRQSNAQLDQIDPNSPLGFGKYSDCTYDELSRTRPEYLYFLITKANWATRWPGRTEGIKSLLNQVQYVPPSPPLQHATQRYPQASNYRGYGQPWN